MTTERQAQVRQPFELTEDRAADVAMARRNWVPVGHTHEDIDGVFVGAMAHLRELALGQQLERGAPEPWTIFFLARASLASGGPVRCAHGDNNPCEFATTTTLALAVFGSLRTGF